MIQSPRSASGPRSSAPLLALLMVGALAAGAGGCGDDEAPSISVSADDQQLAASGSTMLRIKVSGSGEHDVTVSTDVGAVGMLGDSSTTWTTSMGVLDLPFECAEESGLATVVANWDAEAISASTEITCGDQ